MMRAIQAVKLTCPSNLQKVSCMKTFGEGMKKQTGKKLSVQVKIDIA